MKEWFKKNWLSLLAWLMVIGGSAILIYQGITVEEITKGAVLTNGIIIAIGALVAFITGKLKK